MTNPQYQLNYNDQNSNFVPNDEMGRRILQEIGLVGTLPDTTATGAHKNVVKVLFFPNK